MEAPAGHRFCVIRPHRDETGAVVASPPRRLPRLFPPVKVLAGEGAVDTEGCASSFGGGDNRELHIAEHVSGSEYAGYGRGFVLSTSDAAMPVQAASQLHHQRRLRSGRRVEKERVAPDALTICENDFVEFATDD